MGVAVAIGEVNVEVFDGLGDLLLDTSLLLLDFDDATVGSPVSLDALQGLLEEEGQVHSLFAGNCEALEVDVAVVLGELLEKHSLQIVLIEGLDEALLVVVQLGLDVLIEPNARLLVVDWGEDQMEEVLEGLELGQGEVDVIGGTQEGQVFIVWAKHAIILYSVGGHYWPISFLDGFLHFFFALVTLEIHAIVEFSPLSLAGLGHLGSLQMKLLQLLYFELRILGLALQEELETAVVLAEEGRVLCLLDPHLDILILAVIGLHFCAFNPVLVD